MVYRRVRYQGFTRSPGVAWQTDGAGSMRKAAKKLVRETVGGEPYEHYPVGRHIVVAGVCGGRPTFKYTRIDVRHALGLLAAGRTVERVAQGYHLPLAAVREAVALAAKALDQKSRELGHWRFPYPSSRVSCFQTHTRVKAQRWCGRMSLTSESL